LGLNNGLEVAQAGFKIPHMSIQEGFHFSYLLVTFVLMDGKFTCLEQECHDTTDEHAMHNHGDGAQAE